MTKKQSRLIKKAVAYTALGAVIAVVRYAITVLAAIHAGGQSGQHSLLTDFVRGMSGAVWWLAIYFSVAAVIVPIILMVALAAKRSDPNKQEGDGSAKAKRGGPR